MRNRKEGWEEANSWHAIYPVVSVGTKPPLVHIVEAHKSIASQSPSLSQDHYLTCHKGSPRRHLSSFLDHLDVVSTKELLHQGRGSPRAPRKVSSPLHAKSEGRRRLLVSHLGPKAFATPCTTWSTQDSSHMVGTPCAHSALRES
jgi:hypothetical protein